MNRNKFGFVMDGATVPTVQKIQAPEGAQKGITVPVVQQIPSAPPAPNAPANQNSGKQNS